MTSITHTMENDNATIKIFKEEYQCVVTAEVEIDYTEGCSGWMRSGSSSYEDLGDPPSAGEVEVTDATCTVEIFDKDGKDMGTLTLSGTDWFDSWFDDPEEGDLDLG